jgi:hypothetical protein
MPAARRLLFLLMLFVSLGGAGKDVGYHPLDIKLGLWEITLTQWSPLGNWAGIGFGPDLKTFRSCLEKIDEPWDVTLPKVVSDKMHPVTPSSPNAVTGCPVRTLTVSSSSRYENIEACGGVRKSLKIKAKNPEKVSGSIYIVSATDPRFRPGPPFDQSFDARWIGPDCK